MQSVSSRIWTRVAVSISYDDNHYTTGKGLLLEVIWNHSAGWKLFVLDGVLYGQNIQMH